MWTPLEYTHTGHILYLIVLLLCIKENVSIGKVKLESILDVAIISHAVSQWKFNARCMFKKCHNTILHFSREMTRFIGDVCFVMSIVKVHWCKLPVSNYYNFIEFFYPNFFLDWLSCELSEQNCLNCHNFFSGCYEQFVLVFVYIFFLYYYYFTQ